MIREPRAGEDFTSYAKELFAATEGDPEARKVAEAVVWAMDDERQNLPRPRLECGAALYMRLVERRKRRHAADRRCLEHCGLPIRYSGDLAPEQLRYIPAAVVA